MNTGCELIKQTREKPTEDGTKNEGSTRKKKQTTLDLSLSGAIERLPAENHMHRGENAGLAAAAEMPGREKEHLVNVDDALGRNP